MKHFFLMWGLSRDEMRRVYDKRRFNGNLNEFLIIITTKFDFCDWVLNLKNIVLNILQRERERNLWHFGEVVLLPRSWIIYSEFLLLLLNTWNTIAYLSYQVCLWLVNFNVFFFIVNWFRSVFFFVICYKIVYVHCVDDFF